MRVTAAALMAAGAVLLAGVAWWGITVPAHNDVSVAALVCAAVACWCGIGLGMVGLAMLAAKDGGEK